MKTACKLALLSVVAALAAFSAAAAWDTLRQTADLIPAEVYAQYRAKQGKAEYVLREKNGRVAVFRSGRNEPERYTEIETLTLRRADCAMLEKGIPAENMAELLALLEDLGS